MSQDIAPYTPASGRPYAAAEPVVLDANAGPRRRSRAHLFSQVFHLPRHAILKSVGALAAVIALWLLSLPLFFGALWVAPALLVIDSESFRYDRQWRRTAIKWLAGTLFLDYVLAGCVHWLFL